MADLIDRNQAILRMDAMMMRTTSPNERVKLAGISAVLKSIPAADAAPVVHARWVPNNPFTGYCSGCGADGNLKRRYCSNCGALMDADAPERAGKDGRE